MQRTRSHQRRVSRRASPIALALAVWALAPAWATAASAGKIERGPCHTVAAKARVRGLGGGWVLLAEEMVRGAAPDYRVLAYRWTLLGSDGKTRTLELPMAKLWQQLPPTLLGVAQSKRNSAGHIFDTVNIAASYEANVVVGEDGAEVGLIARVGPPPGVRNGKQLAVVWRVEGGEFSVGQQPLAEAGAEGQHGFVAGRDAQGRWLFIAAEAQKAASGATSLRYAVKRLDAASGALVTLASSGPIERTGDRVNAASRCAFSDNRELLACAEYQEDTAHPSGVHVFDLKAGTAKVLAAPATSYVLAFDAAGTRLAIGGNRGAEVFVYDLTSGQRLQTGEGPAKMHQGAYLPDGTLLLHGDGAPTRYDAKLKPIGAVSLADAFGPGAKGGFLPRAVTWSDTNRAGIPVVRAASSSGFGDPEQICWLRPVASPPPRSR